MYQTGTTHISTIVLFIFLGPIISIAFQALKQPALHQLLPTSHGEPMLEGWHCIHQAGSPAEGTCATPRTSTNDHGRPAVPGRASGPLLHGGGPSMALGH